MLSTVKQMPPAPRSSSRSTKSSMVSSVLNSPPVVYCHHGSGPSPDSRNSSMPPLVTNMAPEAAAPRRPPLLPPERSSSCRRPDRRRWDSPVSVPGNRPRCRSCGRRQDLGPEDDPLEGPPVVAEGHFVLGAFGHVVPRHRVQFGLANLAKSNTLTRSRSCFWFSGDESADSSRPDRPARSGEETRNWAKAARA